jgi:ABC-2 type transport system ATP-binding protein
MDDEPVLWCKDLQKRFKERLAVDGVGFVVAPGETYGLLGPNGAGKTTTISMICGLLRRDGGEVTVAGRRLTATPPRSRRPSATCPRTSPSTRT